MQRAKPQPVWRHQLAGCVALLFGIGLMICGYSFLFDAWHFLDQEYLHLWSANDLPSNPQTYFWGPYIGGLVFWLTGLTVTVVAIREARSNFGQPQTLECGDSSPL